jgi:hypothetical protein
MKPGKKVIVMAAAAALLTAVNLKASDPVGVYAVVERVVMTPNDTAPTSVQIFGAFAPSVEPPRPTYKPEQAYGEVQKGYMHFTCPAGKAALCAAEWNDLKSVAGKSEVVGFSTRWARAKARVRPAGEAVASPDVYETNIGVVKLGKYGDYPSIVTALKAAIGRK